MPLQAFIRQKELFPYIQLVYIGQDVDHLWSGLYEEAINAEAVIGILTNAKTTKSS